jgi:hypothetical protein
MNMDEQSLRQTKPIETLLSVAQPPPCIPVKVWHDGRKWRKTPRKGWELATTKRETLEEWWAQWPEAKPGIPLALTDLVAIDLEDCADPAFHEAWRKPEKVVTFKGRPMLVPEPYSIYKTPSGGRHVVFRQPDPPIKGRFRWSEGVEILANCLLTVHDVGAIVYPRVASRAVLPEVFRQPYGAEGNGAGERGHLINKYRALVVDRAIDEVDVAAATDALFTLDARDWRGRHDEWLSIANAAKFAGVHEDDFVQWSLQDEFYRGDEALIRRKWRSLTPKHSGALWAALSERGIKLKHPQGEDTRRRCSLIDEVPPISPEGPEARKTINWRGRFSTWTSILHSDQTERTLFTASCVVAEINAECGKPTLGRGQEALEASCPKLIREIGIDEVRRTIANAYRHVEEKILGERR